MPIFIDGKRTPFDPLFDSALRQSLEDVNAELTDAIANGQSRFQSHADSEHTKQEEQTQDSSKADAEEDADPTEDDSSSRNLKDLSEKLDDLLEDDEFIAASAGFLLGAATIGAATIGAGALALSTLKK